MKNFAKLALTFSISFLVIFIAAAGFRFLGLRVDWAKNIPARPETALTLLITAAHWALTLALFSATLFALSYSHRKGFFAPVAIVTIAVLAFFFSFGISAALENWKAVPPAQSAGIPLGDKGLILSNSLNRSTTAVVLLNGTSDPMGPRVVSINGEPLIYHESAGGNIELPSVPFVDDTPWFLKSLAIDIRLNAELFQKKFNEGFLQYLIYAGALIFLLCALGYSIKFSAWPLANLFLGILAFRGVLALTTFFNTAEMQDVFDSFFKNTMPASYACPLIFLGLGTLLFLYSILVFIIKRREDYEY